MLVCSCFLSAHSLRACRPAPLRLEVTCRGERLENLFCEGLRARRDTPTGYLPSDPKLSAVASYFAASAKTKHWYDLFRYHHLQDVGKLHTCSLHRRQGSAQALPAKADWGTLNGKGHQRVRSLLENTLLVADRGAHHLGAHANNRRNSLQVQLFEHNLDSSLGIIFWGGGEGARSALRTSHRQHIMQHFSRSDGTCLQRAAASIVSSRLLLHSIANTILPPAHCPGGNRFHHVFFFLLLRQTQPGGIHTSGNQLRFLKIRASNEYGEFDKVRRECCGNKNQP